MAAVDEFGGSMLLVGVPVAVLTAVIVQAARQFGLPGRWAPVAAFAAAMGLAALTELVLAFSWLDPVARVVAAGLVFGLASSGSYSWARQTGKGR